MVFRLDSEYLNSVFKGSYTKEVVDITLAIAQKYNEENEDTCKKTINNVFLQSARNSTTSRWPKIFHQSNFNEEYNGIVHLLSRIKGLPNSHYFQTWIWWYMNIIRKGNDMIDWGEQISDAICEQLKEVRTNLKFYMTFYLVYAVASMRKFPRLSTKGDRRQTPVWDYYSKLTIANWGSHCRRVNDVLFVIWKCLFDKELQKKDFQM